MEQLPGSCYGWALAGEGFLRSGERRSGFHKLGGCVCAHRSPLLCQPLDDRHASGHAA
jgi:hypothetical protein